MHIEVTVNRFLNQDATEIVGRIVVTGPDEALGADILAVKERLFDFLKSEYARWQAALAAQ